MNAIFKKIQAMESPSDDVDLDGEMISISTLQLAELLAAAEDSKRQAAEAREETKRVRESKDAEVSQLRNELQDARVEISVYEETFDMKAINVNKKKLVDLKIQHEQDMMRKDQMISKLERKNAQQFMEIHNLKYGDILYHESEQQKRDNQELRTEMFKLRRSHRMEVNQLENKNQELRVTLFAAQRELTTLDLELFGKMNAESGLRRENEVLKRRLARVEGSQSADVQGLVGEGSIEQGGVEENGYGLLRSLRFN